ncbi:hypothetical protein ACETRX_34705 [Labrys portucalensis]|uniref:Uncharacterized protein n=1 Tax=Labrys neptuniae TaxID=376174 RepID=A0ABV6ZRI9_9HYPH
MLALYIAAGIIIALVVIWLFKLFVGAAVPIEAGGRMLLKSDLKKMGVNVAMIPDAALDEIVSYAINQADVMHRMGMSEMPSLRAARIKSIEDMAKIAIVEIEKNKDGQDPVGSVGEILLRYGVLKSPDTMLMAKQDRAVAPLIEAGRRLGAKSAREAAEMASGRALSDVEWERLRPGWERNW